MEDGDGDNRHPYFNNWFDHERLRKWSKISHPFKQDRSVSGVCPDLYRINEVRFSWSTVQAVKLGLQIPEIKFEYTKTSNQ